MNFFSYYFGNLIILTFVYMYNRLVNEKLEEDQNISSGKNQNYDLYLIQGYLIMTTAFVSIPVY